jgi:hypothetical protein
VGGCAALSTLSRLVPHIPSEALVGGLPAMLPGLFEVPRLTLRPLGIAAAAAAAARCCLMLPSPYECSVRRGDRDGCKNSSELCGVTPLK